MLWIIYYYSPRPNHDGLHLLILQDPHLLPRQSPHSSPGEPPETAASPQAQPALPRQPAPHDAPRERHREGDAPAPAVVPQAPQGRARGRGEVAHIHPTYTPPEAQAWRLWKTDEFFAVQVRVFFREALRMSFGGWIGYSPHVVDIDSFSKFSNCYGLKPESRGVNLFFQCRVDWRNHTASNFEITLS